MIGTPIIECVPNFSEGNDLDIIKKITDAIESVEGIKLLDVDPGKATNRTVVTFVGQPAQVIEAAFKAIQKAAELIDMSKHQGEHPRMGATDVCPLIPIANITMEETVQWARKLGEKVGNELLIPVYLYEEAATSPERKNLATIRAGEYEGLQYKLAQPTWKPDFGPSIHNVQSGATVIGARDFLIAYNVNLNTNSVKLANSIAFDIREQGRILRDGDPVTGKIVQDEAGNPKRIPGSCKSVKAIGWYIEEYGMAQISMNLTNVNQTPLHIAFEECCKSAEKRGMRVTGSELVGMVPLKVMLDAGRFFLKKQMRSPGVSNEELISVAIRSLGLNELSPFDANKKIIEYSLKTKENTRLVSMNLREFADETASESPAPGGGSIAAYTGALGVSLATMVANLSGAKRGWEDQWEKFHGLAEKAQIIKDHLLTLVDEDTLAFNQVMAAFKLPKNTAEEIQIRKMVIENANKNAMEVPLKTMRAAWSALEIAEVMIESGNPNSITDVGVGAICIRTAVQGAFLNVLINAGGISDKTFTERILSEAKEILANTEEMVSQYYNKVIQKIEM